MSAIFTPRFLVLFAVGAVLVLEQFGVSFWKKTAFDYQMQKLPKMTEDFLSYAWNASHASDLIIVNLIMAYVLDQHAKSWSLQGFAIIFAVVYTLGIFFYEPLLQDSKTTYSSLFWNGGFTLPGGMHYVYWVVGISLALSFFLLTPLDEVSGFEVWFVTGLLMFHWVVSTVLPPLKAHGYIHDVALAGAAGGLVLLPLLACWLLRIL